jgi:hypothetical protein
MTAGNERREEDEHDDRPDSCQRSYREPTFGQAQAAEADPAFVNLYPEQVTPYPAGN